MARSPQKQWSMDAMKGWENALLPSFSSDLQSLDERGIRWDIAASKRHGFAFSMITMEMGLSQAECIRMIEIATDEAGSELGISMILMRDSLKQNIELLEHAERCGASHATIAYPQHFRADDTESIYRAVRSLCDATSLPIVMYASERFDFGRFHPGSVPVELFDRIVDIPNIAAMKVGFPDPGVIHDVFTRYSDRIQVNIGTAGMLGMFPMLHKRFNVQWGGAGIWEFWQSPEKPYLVEYFDLIMRRRYDDAMKIYWMVSPAHLSAVRNLGGKHAVGGRDLGLEHGLLGKYIQWTVGGNGGLTRPPTAVLTRAMREQRKASLRRIGIEPRTPDSEFFVGRVNNTTRVGTTGRGRPPAEHR